MPSGNGSMPFDGIVGNTTGGGAVVSGNTGKNDEVGADALVDDGRIHVCVKIVESPAKCAERIAASVTDSDHGLGIGRIGYADARRKIVPLCLQRCPSVKRHPHRGCRRC